MSGYEVEYPAVTLDMTKKDSAMIQAPLFLAATSEQCEVLRQALADAVYYRDPPVQCPTCLAPDKLCEECTAGLGRARAYLALGHALGLDTSS